MSANLQERRASYGEGEIPEDCGVNFDGECNPWDYFNSDLDKYNEEIGECAEDDEECFYSRLRNQPQARSSAADAGGSKRTSLKGTEQSLRKSVESENVRALEEKKLPSVRGTIFPEITDNEFDGIPPNYFKKNYKPDYPTELRMKQMCTPKPLRKRTIGTTKTQPKAVFIPSDSTFSRKDNASACSRSGKRTSWSGSTRVSTTKVDGDGNVKDIDFEEPSALEENRLPPPIISSSDEVVVDWLEDHNIQLMFEYFLGLCVIHQPDDPWDFISQLAGKFIEARTELQVFDGLPRILTPEHTEAIFRIYDRIENGFITIAQYKSAMEAMGLNRYSLSPEGLEENAISKDTFVRESTEAISDLLRSFMVFKEIPLEEQPPEATGESAQDGSGSAINREFGSGTQAREISSSGNSSSDKSRTTTGSDDANRAADDSAPLTFF